MPVTRAMTRQTKDETMGSNPSFCPIPAPKTAKATRTKAKAAATTSTKATPAAPVKSTSKKEAGGQPKAKSKKATTAKGTARRRRGKVLDEAAEDVEEEEEEVEEQKMDHIIEPQEAQNNAEPEPEPIEFKRESKSQVQHQDIDSASPLVLDDPDVMLDSFQRAPKQGQLGVRFAPSPETSMILEDRELEEEEELKEENRAMDTKRTELRSQLQKFGAKFHPDGAVIAQLKDAVRIGRNAIKTAETAVETRYREALKQLESQRPENGTSLVPNTPLMKTLTSRVGLKRPRSPDEMFDDESPLPKPNNAPPSLLLSHQPSTSTPLPSIPQSFDFQNMTSKQPQKKLILDKDALTQNKPHAKVLHKDKDNACSPAKKPRIQELAGVDVDNIDNMKIPDIKTPTKEFEGMKIAGTSTRLDLPAPPSARSVSPRIRTTPVKPKAVLVAVPEESSKPDEDSIIFCEEVIKVSKPISKKMPARSSPDRNQIQHESALLQPKAEPLEKVVKVNVQPPETTEMGPPAITASESVGVPNTAKEVLLKHLIDDTEIAFNFSPAQQKSKPGNATFSVESMNESFHDANATFTTSNPTSANGATSEQNRPLIGPQELNIMNETITLNESMSRTPETKDSYNITLYEDFDEENKHRENKKIPDWASNKLNLNRELLLMGPSVYQKFVNQTVIKRDPIFPAHRPNFKLFPDVAPKIRK